MKSFWCLNVHGFSVRNTPLVNLKSCPKTLQTSMLLKIDEVSKTKGPEKRAGTKLDTLRDTFLFFLKRSGK